MDTDNMVIVSFPKGIFSGIGFQAVYKNKQAFGQTADDAVTIVTHGEPPGIVVGVEWFTDVREA